MNFSKLSLAVAGAMVAGNAFALAPNAINPEAPGANDIVIHYAGATAQSDTVKNLTLALCAPGTRDVYTNAAGTPTHLAVTCTLATPIAGKSNLYFSYHLNGGSVYGVTPVADQLSLPYMKVFGGSCTGASPAYTCSNSAVNQYLAAPQAGGSDVEPAMFKGSNVSGLAFGSPSATGLSNLNIQPGFQVVFGLAVNKALLDGTVYPGGTGTIKSLSKTEAADIFSGLKAQWDAVPAYGNMENYANGGVMTNIHVCRRKAGSGTQAGAQAYFLAEGCNATARAFATATNWSVPGELEEISSSTNILTQCVNTNTRAIGISSLEKLPGTTYGNNWAYVAIDGIMPTEENAAKGLYDYYFENSMQYNTTVVSAAQQGFLNLLFSEAKNATALVGLPGVLGVPDFVINTPADLADSNLNGILVEYLPSNPTSWVTRDTQACRPSAHAL